MTTPALYRQGDVLIETVTHMPSTVTPKARDAGRIVLAYGEVTGHTHAIDDALAEVFEDRDGTLYLRVGGPVEVTHEEHAAIPLSPGIYRVTHQREYSPEAPRRVTD